MKYLIILLFSTKIFGASSENVPKLEDSMIYIKNGTTVSDFLNETNTILNSIGYIRYSDQFIYGLEQNSFYGETLGYRVSSTQIVSGYRHLWSKPYIPYVLFQFGTSNFNKEKISENQQLPKFGTGISTTFDVGFDIIKIFSVKGSIGIRKSNCLFKDPMIKEATFNDLYFTIGFVF